MSISTPLTWAETAAQTFLARCGLLHTRHLYSALTLDIQAAYDTAHADGKTPPLVLRDHQVFELKVSFGHIGCETTDILVARSEAEAHQYAETQFNTKVNPIELKRLDILVMGGVTVLR